MSNAFDENQYTQDENETKHRVQQFKELPKMHTTYANIIKSLVPTRDKTIAADELPTHIYCVPNFMIDEDNLNDYRKVCGFIKDGRVPATYFAVVSQTLQMNMMAKPDFPFAMLGLVHLFNSVTQYRPIYDSEVVQLSVRLGNLRAHSKGQQFDFITEVKIEDVLVWQGVSTYLSRQKRPKEDKVEKETTLAPTTPCDDSFIKVFEVPEDIGRRYAFVSGDFNLIHLHPLSARAFGFPRAIAHGMWTKAMIVSSLVQHAPLPERYRMEVTFKSPVFLPSAVKLVANHHQQGYDIALYDDKGDKVHVVGELVAL